MRIREIENGIWHEVTVEPVAAEDWPFIHKKRFFFNWRKEMGYSVYKLNIIGSEEILGLVSLETNREEEWILIRLIAVAKQNRGAKKQYEGIVANLMAFVYRLAIKQFKENACVALLPKTELSAHYKRLYGMVEVGRRLALFGVNLIRFMKQHEE